MFLVLIGSQNKEKNIIFIPIYNIRRVWKNVTIGKKQRKDTPKMLIGSYSILINLKKRVNPRKTLFFNCFNNLIFTSKTIQPMRKISYRFVYNRKKRLNDRGMALVQVEAYLCKKKAYFTTHVYLTPDQWDDKRKIIVSHPSQEFLNAMLNDFMINLEKKELALWRQGRPITLNLLKEEFKTTLEASFLSFARNEIMKSQLKESTKRNHLTTITLLRAFKPAIDFADITYNFISDFESFLYNDGYQINTIAKHMKHLKSFVNAAIDKGFIDSNDYAFKRYKIKVKESKHVFLFPEELEALEKLSLEGKNCSLQHTLDAFLFCCYTGLRYSDFVNLKDSNLIKIEGKLWLIFNSVKTGTEVKLPLYLLFNGQALGLLHKYRGRWESFFALKNNSSVNKELIRIGRLARIEKHFSFHSARHTNATLLIYKGANITTVQKLLGHKNIATTQIYGEVMGSTIVRDLKKCQKG